MTVTGYREVLCTVSGVNGRVLVPDTYNSLKRTTVVMYHGGVGETETAATNDSLKEGIVQALVDAGCLVAAVNGYAGDDWGNQTALDDYDAMYDFVSTRWDGDDVIILCQSMGGLSGLSAYAGNLYANVRGYVGIQPCTNLSAMFAANAGSYASSIRTAYGIAADGSDYATKTSGYDPNLYTTSVWSGKSFRFYASSGDTVVSKTNNSDAMLTKVTSGGASVASVVSCTGNHGDPSHFQPFNLLGYMRSLGCFV